MTTRTLQWLVLAGLTIAAIGALLVFRDGIGLLVFVLLGAIVLVQLARFALDSGSSRTLKRLWDAFKDAFWGIG